MFYLKVNIRDTVAGQSTHSIEAGGVFEDRLTNSRACALTSAQLCSQQYFQFPFVGFVLLNVFLLFMGSLRCRRIQVLLTHHSHSAYSPAPEYSKAWFTCKDKRDVKNMTSEKTIKFESSRLTLDRVEIIVLIRKNKDDKIKNYNCKLRRFTSYF
jgi:hypothetical protein